MEIVKTAVAVLAICAGPCQAVSACGGQIDDISGHIQSPNFGAEYGKVANCSWRFDYINTKYTLRLKLTDMRMFYYDYNSVKQCSDAYRLIINGEPIDCMMEIVSGSTAPQFYAFYSNPSFAELQCGRECQNLIKIDSTSINVQYIADGRKPNANANAREMLGFKIKYEYVKCPEGKATTFADDQSVSSRVSSATLTKSLTPPTTTPPTPTHVQTPATPPTTTHDTATIATPTTTETAAPANTKIVTSSPPSPTHTTAVTAKTTRQTTTSRPSSQPTAPATPSPPTSTTTIPFISTTSTKSPDSTSSQMVPTIPTTDDTFQIQFDNETEINDSSSLTFALIGGGGGFLVIVVVIILLFVRKRKRGKNPGNSGSGCDESGGEELGCEETGGGMTENVLYGTSNDLVNDASHGPLDPSIIYAEVDLSSKISKTEERKADIKHDVSHAPVNSAGMHAVVDENTKSSKPEPATHAEVNKPANADDSVEPEAMKATPAATPTSMPLLYASVTVHEGGGKSTFHVRN